LNFDAHPRSSLIVALDFDSLNTALKFAKQVADLVGMFKIGSQLFTAAGPAAVKEISALGPGIFLDLKFHDIPNTVAHGVASAARLPGVRLVTLHTTGGLAMMRAARQAAYEFAGDTKKRPRLLGVTILTSMDESTLAEVGLAGPPAARGVELAKLAQKAGLDGVVASAHEVRLIREACGAGFLIVVPGIRPAESSTDDQARVATPAQAISAGADYLVVGRPITASKDPRKAALAISKEIASVS
jgi:orotidine-5'-phosphate decarboxylase